MLPGSFRQRMSVILAEDRKCTSQKQRGCSVRKSWMKYRPGESMRRETDPVQRRNENSRNEKKQLVRRRRKVLLILFLVLLIFGAAFGYFLYQNSYVGKVAKGYDALQMKEYQTAEKYFKHAIGKNAQRAEAYSGLAETYMEQDEGDEAESVFLSAIASYPSNEELYRAAISFYEETKQLDKISEILEDCDDESVLSSLKAYVSTEPVFSLDDGKYSEVQEVTLSASGETIYYTTDGTNPTSSSTKYTEPILLNEEGKTQIKAIAYNKKKIPSLVVSKTYEIEFPVADAPVVTPSTGQYSTATQISITVPEGYTAYYTTDGSTPTTESSLYTGPIEMPEGQTLFSTVLVGKTGKMTQITKRIIFISRSKSWLIFLDKHFVKMQGDFLTKMSLVFVHYLTKKNGSFVV